MNLRHAKETPGPFWRGALRHDVVKRLLMSIFQGELPAGTRLAAKRLAEGRGISATPIREALVELEAVGLVELLHNRGALVKAFGQQQLREFFHVRRILETEATRCACQHFDPPSLEALSSQAKNLLEADGHPADEWLARTISADRQLHEAIATRCGNARLAHEIHRYDTLMQCLREIAGNRNQLQVKGVEEHVSILDMLAARDAGAAAAAMAQHIDSMGESIEAVIFSGR